MRVTREQIAGNFKRLSEGSSTHHPRQVGRRFADWVKEQVGLCDNKGRPYTRPDGFPTFGKEPPKAVGDFDLLAVTEGLLGVGWYDAVRRPRSEWLSEEAAAPVGPSTLSNFNAWTATVGGLIQAEVLSGYETAEYDLRDLFPVRPVKFWQGGERYVNVIGPSKMAPEVGPAESHPNMRMDGMWVEAAGTKKYGAKITVTKETAYVDVAGGQVLAEARKLGQTLAFRENDLSANVIVGSTNNWKLGLTNDASATGYNTYGATVPTGLGTTGTLGNDITNPMTDPATTWQASQDALLQYKHPVTGIPMPMASRLRTVLVPASLEWLAMYMSGVTQLTQGANPAAPFPQTLSTPTVFPTAWMNGPNPFKGVISTTRVSQWLMTKHMASATPVDPDIPVGLGLSLANSRRWYRMDPEAFACRRAAWEAQVIDLNPSDYVMADQGIVAGQVGNIAMMVQVLNAFAIQRNKVS